MTDKQPGLGDRVRATVHIGDYYAKCSRLCQTHEGLVIAMGRGLITIYDGIEGHTVPERMVTKVYRETPRKVDEIPNFLDLIASGLLVEVGE